MKSRYKIRYHPLYDKFILKIIFSGEIFNEDYKDFYHADKNKIDKIYKSFIIQTNDKHTIQEFV